MFADIWSCKEISDGTKMREDGLVQTEASIAVEKGEMPRRCKCKVDGVRLYEHATFWRKRISHQKSICRQTSAKKRALHHHIGTGKEQGFSTSISIHGCWARLLRNWRTTPPLFPHRR